MRNLKSLQFYKVATFMALFVIFSSSCKKDAAVSPAYVGTWVAMETYSSGGTDMSIKDIMTLTETSFNDLGKMQLPTGQWVDLLNMKGSISIQGNIMNVTVTDIGMSAFSMVTGLPIGQITTYKAGSTEFDDLMSQTGQSKTFKSEYSVSGNQLTLKTDNNGDGDYLDENETTVYTKQ